MAAFKKVLCACDFSHISYQVLDQAVQLCSKMAVNGMDVSLLLLHVVHPAPITIPAAVGDGLTNFAQVQESYIALNQEAQEAATARLRRLVSARVPKRIATNVLAPCGDSALEVLRVAEEEKCDVLVLGTHGLTGWRHFVLGSVTEEVIRMAPCPVMAIGPHQRPVKEDADGPMKFLCPIDFSEPSMLALEKAGELAQTLQAELHIIHVLESMDPVLGIVSREEFQESRFKDAALAMLPVIENHLPAELRKDVKLHRLVCEGDPAEEIVKAVDEGRYDLVVMSTQGRGGWRRLVFGSVAQAVVRTSPCAVLTVRDHHAKTESDGQKNETKRAVTPSAAGDEFDVLTELGKAHHLADGGLERSADHPVDPYAVSENEFPRFHSAPEKLRFLLNYAVLAPSARNTQPWLWKLEDDHLELYADRRRGLQTLDPEGCALLMSCGASLFQLRLAMWHFGYEDEVQYFPNPDEPDLLARISLGGMRDESAEEKQLFAAITRRRTDRKSFEKREIEASLRFELEQAASLEGVHLHFVESMLKKDVIDLVERGDIELGHNQEYREEVARWTSTIGRPQQDGIPVHALGVNAIVALTAPSLLRSVDTGKLQARKDRALAENAAALLTLSTTEDTPSAWLAAGQALARVLLCACAHGAYASFLNAPLETASQWPRLRRLLRLEGFPLLLFRLGYVDQDVKLKHTPRRSVGDVLIDLEAYSEKTAG